MTRTAVLIAALCLLSACATRSHPPADLALPVAPQACDPRLTAPTEPEPPVAGAIVQPATPEERAAVEAFLSAEAQARAWGREGWARAETARAACAAEITGRAAVRRLRR